MSERINVIFSSTNKNFLYNCEIPISMLPRIGERIRLSIPGHSDIRCYVEDMEWQYAELEKESISRSLHGSRCCRKTEKSVKVHECESVEVKKFKNEMPLDKHLTLSHCRAAAKASWRSSAATFPQ